MIIQRLGIILMFGAAPVAAAELTFFGCDQDQGGYLVHNIAEFERVRE